MRHTASRELFGYWNRIRDGRAAPRRDEIEPSDIRHLLADTFILEVSEALKTISYRLAGTRVCTTFGRELKGLGFLAHWSENDNFEAARLLTGVYRDLKPTLIILRGHALDGKSADFEMLLLPLETMPDGSARIIGIMTTSSKAYWLGAEAIRECDIRSSRVLDPDDMADSLAQRRRSSDGTPQLAPSQSQTASLNTSAIDGELEPSVRKRVAHLVVHDGGKS